MMILKPPSKEEILEVIHPYLRRALPLADAEMSAWRRASRRGTFIAATKQGVRQILKGRMERQEAFVSQLYNGTAGYAGGIAPLEALLGPGVKLRRMFFGGDTVLEMGPGGLFSAYLTAMTAAIRALGPQSVCEVGFGTGKNLIYLAPRFPNIQFSGYELTQNGVAVARGLQKDDRLPPNLGRFVGYGDADSMAAIRRIDFQQGDASNLPAADKSVDLTFTMLALEQMWSILPRALAEIRRVTRRHVVFVEAFRDVNDWLARYDLWSRNYFRASQAEVAAAGFRSLALWRCFPDKPTFSTAMMIAEVLP